MIFVFDDIRTFSNIFAYLEMPDGETDRYGFDWAAIWLNEDDTTLCSVDGNKKYYKIVNTKLIPTMPFGSSNATVRGSNGINYNEVCETIQRAIDNGYIIKDSSALVRTLLRNYNS